MIKVDKPITMESFANFLTQVPNGFEVEDFGNYYGIRPKTEEEILKELRQSREIECFSVINRGKFWYDTLTAEQTAQLHEWYRAWLNVTETKVIPDKLQWLN